MGDIHPQGNPHYWIPPDNALIVAREIAERLEAIDGAGAATYQREPQEVRGRSWRGAGSSGRSARRGVRGTKVVTYHKSWSYVSKWLGLQEVGYVEPKPGIPAPPSHIAWLIGLDAARGRRR